MLIVSTVFPSYHSKKGIKTDFIQKIQQHIKTHTIRVSYGYWKKRINEVNLGNAYISLRTWQGKPRMQGSKQIEHCQFHQGAIGIQKIEWNDNLKWIIDDVDSTLRINEIIANDGLSGFDFIEWFNEFPDQPAAIIHFTDFRY